MKTKLQQVTPEMALKWLEKNNPTNRPISQGTVELFAHDMKAGLWRTTHQGIAFDTDGNLQDGQHRLAAVVKSMETIEMLVTTEVPSSFKSNGTHLKTFEVIDTGLKRTPAQMLKMQGVQYATAICAAVRNVIILCSRRPEAEDVKMSTPTIHKGMEYIGESCETVVGLCQKSGGIVRLPAYVSAPALILHGNHPQEIEEFLKETNQVTGSASSPSRALASWVRHHANQKGLGPMSVACSALHRCLTKNTAAKLTGSQESVDWVRKQNPELCKKLAALIA